MRKKRPESRVQGPEQKRPGSRVQGPEQRQKTRRLPLLLSSLDSRLSTVPILFLALIIITFTRSTAQPLTAPSYEPRLEKAAERMNRAARGSLAPVYPYLADYIVREFGLAEKPGIGIDLGSGPGDLIVELARRTASMYWVNADINSYAFKYFFESAAEAGMAHRVGAVFADAQRLPFRDDYADVIVSRGSYHFWKDKGLAFSEIYRVLKPGGVVFIGRGFPETMPVETARAVRDKQKGGPQYDIEKSEAELRALMAALDIGDYRIIVPKRQETDVNYGIWMRFSKAGN